MVCECDKLKNAIRLGIESMKEECASSFAIVDYIYEMQNGLWVGCEGCSESKMED